MDPTNDIEATEDELRMVLELQQEHLKNRAHLENMCQLAHAQVNRERITPEQRSALDFVESVLDWYRRPPPTANEIIISKRNNEKK